MIPNQIARLHQPAAGFHQAAAFIGNDDVDALDPRQVCLQRVGEIMDVDHRALDSGRTQPIEHMIEQRLARHLDQRLRPRRRQRAHPLAQAGGHHHRGFGHLAAGIGADRQGALRRHRAAISIGSPRSAGGTCASNQALTGASSGIARSCSR